jgi:hypothetical protein
MEFVNFLTETVKKVNEVTNGTPETGKKEEPTNIPVDSPLAPISPVVIPEVKTPTIGNDSPSSTTPIQTDNPVLAILKQKIQLYTR